MMVFKKKLKQVVIKCNELNHQNFVSKKYDVNGFNVSVLVRTRQALLGKEMSVKANKNYQIVNFFKPFDYWLGQQLNVLESGETPAASSVVENSI